MIGKFADGLKGFPTPNTAAGTAAYLLLLFEDREWAQYALGALTALTTGYNWYKSGELDPDEAAELFRVIVQEAPYNKKGCSNPDGGKILRVAPDGHVQQLSDNNEWEQPDGDYTIPPVPSREGEDDPICAAAANAANVLQLLYENVTDSFNAGLGEAAAAAELALGAVALIGVEFAPITFALVTFFGVVFGTFYGVLEFVSADVWTDGFTQDLTCILRACAVNTDGVITFDYDCFTASLAGQTDVTDLSFTQLRLFGQIEYLLLVIGGVDALNQAGATTAIVDPNCDPCITWTYRWDFTLTDGGWENCVDAGGAGTWVDGSGFRADFYGHCGGDGCYNEVYQWSQPFDLASDTQILRFDSEWSQQGVSSGGHWEEWLGASRSEGLAFGRMQGYQSTWFMTQGVDGEIDGVETGVRLCTGVNAQELPMYLEAGSITGLGTRPAFTGGSFI